MTRPLVTILDDEPEIRSLLADVLEEAGFDTLSFGRARAFEAALATHTPDVCLVDLSLPDTDGLTLVHRLALERGAIVIIISGRAQVQDRVTGLELGADDYIINLSIRPRLLRASAPACAASNPRPRQAMSLHSTAGPPFRTPTRWKTRQEPKPVFPCRRRSSPPVSRRTPNA